LSVSYPLPFFQLGTKPQTKCLGQLAEAIRQFAEIVEQSGNAKNLLEKQKEEHFHGNFEAVWQTDRIVTCCHCLADTLEGLCKNEAQQ